MEVDDFQKYYKMLGLERAQNVKELNDLLIKAVKSSRRKGYHGQECDSEMPDVMDQAIKREAAFISQVAHIKIETETLDGNVSEEDSLSDVDKEAGSKKKVKIHVKSIKLKDEWIKASDDKWKELCIKNFDFIS